MTTDGTSALYEGSLHHRRRGPRGHAFSYSIAMPYLDVSEVEAAFAQHPLWSVGRPNVVSLRRADYLGDPKVALDDAVRDLVAARTGRRTEGPIRMLTNVRTWGWLFNPITIYLCFDANGGAIEAIVLEVTNTPWHERHAYVIEGGEGEHVFDKDLHVSPFFGMGYRYRLRIGTPGERFVIHLSMLDRHAAGGPSVFDATLALQRRALDRRTMSRVLWRYPLHTMRVSAGIYWQALRLGAKGVRFHAHPAHRRGAGAANA